MPRFGMTIVRWSGWRRWPWRHCWPGSSIGWAWVSDYGSPEDPEEFKALYAYSPYHNIKPGVAYPATLITTAEEISGSFAAGGPPMSIPNICRVAGTITPAIRFEVWLPEAYNGRFQAVGGGGLAGNISYPAMATAVSDGFASASTDTGHRANDSEWLGDPGRRRDYGYRAIHEMTVAAKAAIRTFVRMSIPRRTGAGMRSSSSR